MKPTSVTPRARVVILGAGFGGLSAAKALANSPFEVTIVDQHNYHLFQPLLYQVAPPACRRRTLHLLFVRSCAMHET